MKPRRLNAHRFSEEDDDPLSGMANLFDLAMVFAVALMVAAVSFLKIQDFFTERDMTVVKNPGAANMEIIVKKDREVTRYKASSTKGQGQGRRVGTAYQLEDGRIVYVPEETVAPAPSATKP